MTLTGKQLINGSFRADSSITFTATDRNTSLQLSDHFYEATAAEINAACSSAADAFESYRHTSGKEKAILLEAIAAQIEALGDALLTQAAIETGLPMPRLQGERTRTTNQLRLFAKLVHDGHWVQAIIETAQPERKPLPKPDQRSMQIALGPVAVFGASNFPFAFSVAGGDTASALAAGCPVIFKAHPAHPGTCEMVGLAIAKAIEQTGMPAGVFNMVHGAGTTVGQSLVANPNIKAVAFTGSFNGGKALFDTAAKREEPIPVYAEMGSVNPVFFLPGIVAKEGVNLANNFAASITMGVGQFCTNPGVFVMQSADESNQFAQQTKEALAAIKTAPMLTNAISANYQKGIQNLARLTHVTPDEQAGPQLFVCNASDALANQTLTEEVFGPCSVGIMANDKQDLLHFARSLKGQLTATVHGTDEDLLEFKELLDILQLKAGRLLINNFPTGVEVNSAMVHGGPYPATTDSRTTSVGTQSIYRFTRPICFQGYPDHLLPEALKMGNPLGILRIVDGHSGM